MSDQLIDLKPLSKRARAIAMAWFSHITPGKGDVTLHLRENKPTAETQAALDELLTAGVISVEPFNSYGGLVYRPLVNCRPAFLWFSQNADDPDLKFQIMEPVSPA